MDSQNIRCTNKSATDTTSLNRFDIVKRQLDMITPDRQYDSISAKIVPPVLPPRLRPEEINIPALPPRPGYEEKLDQSASVKVELTYDIADRDNFS